MDVIKVSPEQLEGFSGNLQSSASQLDSILEELRSKLDAMQWSGGDKESYEAQRLQWNSAVSDLNLLLNRIGRAVGTAKMDYQSTEGMNAKMFVA